MSVTPTPFETRVLPRWNISTFFHGMSNQWHFSGVFCTTLFSMHICMPTNKLTDQISMSFSGVPTEDSYSHKVKPKFSPTFHFLGLGFFFVLLCLFATMTVSYCVAGYRGAASPSAMLLDLWFPVKHNESYIRLFKVRWCAICSPAWKTLSNRDQQKATTSLVSSEYSYSHSDKKADDSLPAENTVFPPFFAVFSWTWCVT